MQRRSVVIVGMALLRRAQYVEKGKEKKPAPREAS